MPVLPSHQPPPVHPSESDIRAAVERAAHWLPSQGPIEVFVHHNTLHCLESLSFHEAVQAGLNRYQAQPYLSELRYHELLRAGRIVEDDLQAVVQELVAEPNEPIANLATRESLYLALLRQPLHTGTDAELRWQIAETDALDRFRPSTLPQLRTAMVQATRTWLSEKDQPAANLQDELLAKFGPQPERWSEACWESATLQWLWSVCKQGAGIWSSAVAASPQATRRDRVIRPRDQLLQAFGADIDRPVHELLSRFCAAYLDQGYSSWTLPQRDKGFYEAFLALFSESLGDHRWRKLPEELRALKSANVTPEACILQSLSELEIAPTDFDEFLTQSLLSLRGWAGMVWQLEAGVDWVVHPAPASSLVGMLAIQLLLERHAIQELGRSVSATLREAEQMNTEKLDRVPRAQLHRAYTLFQTAQRLGWRPDQLQQLSESQWEELGAVLDQISELRRRQIFQEAYERRYRDAALTAFAIHAQDRTESRQRDHDRPTFQIVTCIDDREESFRRHLEEVAPKCETFGAAGFFAVAIYYRGAADGFYQPLCPGVITPEHYVQEDVGYTFAGLHRDRAELRRRLGWASHVFHTRSRTFLGGMAAGIMGSLATAPLVARVLFPRLTSRIRRRFSSLLQPPPVTKLQLERYAEQAGPDNGHVGFTTDEMAQVVTRLLQDLGLKDSADFSRLFVVCGHGSSSLNNPHESAYCCGACAGKRGGPNARAFAEMANDWRVRAKVAELGIQIPDDTYFVGAYHNTCDDSVVFYDLNRLPASHHLDFETAREAIETARQRNAHERCRRFHGASVRWTPQEALRHVEGRAEDISQARPEYNHASNALCIVGRRDWTRGLFLDRRSFLTSYDPARDDEEHSILARILAAAIPVCAGINLEYYFSSVDNAVYGSGSKLPHNLVSLLGVMEGTSSDLRTGLYQQMVEIHEPLRLLVVIECSQEVMLSIMERNPTIDRLCRGNWVHLAVISPHAQPAEAGQQRTGAPIELFVNGAFVPFDPTATALPKRASSLQCYQGSREHLPFFSIHDEARG